MRAGDIVAERFEIEREAGSGGMSVVFRAQDRLTGQPVALKLLEAQDERAEARFRREASLLADLRHPGIVRYVAHGTGAPSWLAMEWLEGEDLAQRLSRGGLAVVEAVTLLRQVAEALAAAHARGIVHRDVKPSNLFLPGGDISRVKVLDFGVARHGRVSELTLTGARVGTPAYMSPEQARGL